MAKLVLTDILTLQDVVDAINDNSTATATAMENTLSRDGTSPNAMEADLDINSNRILNLVAPTTNTEPVRLIDITALDEFTVLHADSIIFEPAGTIEALDVQAAIEELDSDITAHLADAVAAHAGTAISNTPAGNIAATTVQAAIDELDTEKHALNSQFSIAATTTPYNADPFAANTGYFGDYDQQTANLLYLTQSEVQAGESGTIRNALTVWHNDNDGTDYESAVYRTISDGMRVGVFGKYNAGTYEATYKDLHAVTATAIGRVEWAERGVSAFAGDCTQFGDGVALAMELGAYNPSTATNQSGHVAGILALVSAKKAAADASHKAYVFEGHNIGKSITSFFHTFSLGTDGDNGQAQYWLMGGDCTVNTAAIVMPTSASTFEGKMIVYDTGDYSYYETAGNSYIWTIGSTNRAQLDAGNFFPSTNDGMALGTASFNWADLFLASGGVINWNNGDVLLTHASNFLTLSGGRVAVVPDANTTANTNTSYAIQVHHSNGSSGIQLGIGSDAAGLAFIQGWGGNILVLNGQGNQVHVGPNGIHPASSDGSMLGSTSLMWSDLFLASGAVINWNNGDATLTHAANTLAFAGASNGYTFDSTVSTATLLRSYNATATPAAASAVAGVAFGSALVGVYWGTGSPGGVVTAPKGSLYIRTDATTTTTRLFINTDAGTTWANFTTSA